jgi:uncharacterized damage-inducible protein DinB
MQIIFAIFIKVAGVSLIKAACTPWKAQRAGWQKFSRIFKKYLHNKQIMVIQMLKTFYIRDLKKLREEITLYKNEKTIWITSKEIANSAGNLCLHLVGNLNTYIGAVMGNTGYIRNRDLEFSLKDISKDELLKKIDDTILVIEKTLDKINDELLAGEYPLLVFKQKTNTGYMLVHLSTHLAYHLGQVNYHRRLLDN